MTGAAGAAAADLGAVTAEAEASGLSELAGRRGPGRGDRGDGGARVVRARRPPDRPRRRRFDGEEEARGVLLMADGGSRDFLRVVACGSVDDGKSTLIGRLLHEAGRVPDDE